MLRWRRIAMLRWVAMWALLHLCHGLACGGYCVRCARLHALPRTAASERAVLEVERQLRASGQ